MNNSTISKHDKSLNNHVDKTTNKCLTSHKKSSSNNLSTGLSNSQTSSRTNPHKSRSPSRASTEDRILYKRAPAEDDLRLSQDLPSRPATSQSRSTQIQEIDYSKNKGGCKARGCSKPSDQQEEDVDNDDELSTKTKHLSDQSERSMNIEELITTSKDMNRGNQAIEEEAMDLEDNGPALNNNSQADVNIEVQEPLDLSQRTLSALLGYINAMGMTDIEKKFFINQKCMLCGQGIGRRFREHVKKHFGKNNSIESNYSICLQEDGQGLQVECKRCSKAFSHPTTKTLNEHSLACNFPNINVLRRPNTNQDYKKLEKKSTAQINSLKKRATAIATRLSKTEKKVSGVCRTQGTMKKRQTALENRVEATEKKMENVEDKVNNHEEVMVKLMNFLIELGEFKKPREAVTSTSVFDRLVPVHKVKEMQRDRERSRERAARNKSQERMAVRQTRERSEERRTRRREDTSRERSEDRKAVRHHNKRR